MRLSSQNLSFKKRDMSENGSANNSNLNAKTRLLQGNNSSNPGFSSNSQKSNVSFKGLNLLKFYKEPVVYENYRKLLDIASNDLGEAGNKLIKELEGFLEPSNPHFNKVSKRLSIDKATGTIAFKDKSFLKLVMDSALFPVVEMPVLIKDFGVKLLSKAKIIKHPEKYLSGHNIDEQVNILKGVINKTNSLVGKYIVDQGKKNVNVTIDDIHKLTENPSEISEGLFKTANRYFDPKVGNYNTVHERALNRIVSGLIPAAFLANDAYNLSVLCGDKKEQSSKEKDTRFKQEVTRILTNAYLTLITLGSLTKYVNSSPVFSAMVSAATVLFTETTSRLTNGRPITFISKEKAKDINKKKAEKEKTTANASPAEKSSNQFQDNKAQAANATEIKNDKSKASFGDKEVESKKSEKEDKKTDKKSSEGQKSIITFDAFLKAVATIVAGGFAIGFLRNNSKINNELKIPIDKTLNEISNFWQNKIYKKIVQKDFEIDEKDVDLVIKTLSESKYSKLAKNYSSIIKDKAKDGVIKFELHENKNPLLIADEATENIKDFLKIDNKFKPFVDLVVEPFKFVWATIRLPYKITKALINIPASSINSKSQKFKDAANILKSETALAFEKKEASTIKDVTQAQKEFAERFGEFFVKASNKKYEPVVDKIDDFLSGQIDEQKFLEILDKYAVRKPSAAGVSEISKNLNKIGKENYDKKDFVAFLKKSGFFAESKKEISESEKTFAKSIEKILDKVKAYKSGKISEKEFKDFVDKSILSSFNTTSSSKISNADLGMITKIASSAVTSTFLVADNYNMVMLKSDGENKQEAWLRAKERIVQRISALFYQTMLMNWFNGTFANKYHSSLSGMSTVVAANTVSTEVFTRKSIGMPIGPKTYDELVDIDNKNLNREGFLGKYFRFMSALTGKKPLARKAPKEQPNQVANISPFEMLKQLNNKDLTTNLLEMYAPQK